MPSTVRLSDKTLLCARRRRAGPAESKKRWIDAFVSYDNGLSWAFRSDPAPDAGEGNPPHLIKLQDGRLCVTYGFRAAPFEIHARLSNNQGVSWSAPFVVRRNGAGRDLGYPRTVELPNGNLVTIYYFHDKTKVERKIIATTWHPG